MAVAGKLIHVAEQCPIVLAALDATSIKPYPERGELDLARPGVCIRSGCSEHGLRGLPLIGHWRILRVKALPL